MPIEGLSYADEINQDTQDRESQLRLSLQQGMKQDPEAAARAQALARSRGIPADTAARNLPALQAEADADKIDYSGIIAKNESLADFLSDPENAAIAHDDIGSLSKIGDYGRAFAGDAVKSLASGTAGMGTTIDAAALKLRQGAAYVGVPDSILGALDIEIPGSRFITDTFRRETEGAKNYGESLLPAKERRNYGTDLAGGVGQVAANILTYLANPTLATGLMFGQGADQQAESADAAGATPEQRANAVLLGGTATAVTERIEMGFLLKGVPGLDKLATNLPAALQAKWFKVPLEVGAAGIAEGSQEVLEGFLHDTIEYFTYNPDVKFFKGIQDEFAVAGGAGAVMRGIIMAVGGARKHLAQERVVEQSETLKSQAQAARESKTAQRSPEKFKDYIRKMQGDGALYVSPEAGTTFYQSLTEDDRKRLDDAMPDFAARVEEAKVTGADIEVGHDEYLAHIAPLDQGETLAEHLKRQPDGFSAAEAMDMQDEVEELLAPSEAETLERRLYDEIVNTGMTPDAARIKARKFRAAYETLSERVGENPELQQMVDEAFGGLSIQNESIQSRAKFDDLDLLIGEAQSYYRTKSKAKRSTDLLGDKVKGKEKATPRPLLNYLIDKGGIDRYGMVAGELRNLGITPENTPRLFAKGGRRDIDNLVVSEFNNAFADRDVVAVDDGNGYIDRNWLLEQLRDESFGKYHMTHDERARAERIGYYDEIYNYLGNRGLDLLGSPKEEIRKALEEQNVEEKTFYQDAVDKLDALLEIAKQPGNDKVEEELGAASQWLVQTGQKGGHDIAGYVHTIDAYALRHIINEHGGAEERNRGQVEITEDDIRSIADLLESPEIVVSGFKTKVGREGIGYLKTMADGSILFLEEIRSPKRNLKRLAAVSMRKYTATMNAEKIIATLDPYAQGDSGTLIITNVPQNTSMVGENESAQWDSKPAVAPDPVITPEKLGVDQATMEKVAELEQPQPEFAPEAKPEKADFSEIADFGEKIAGARKDVWKGYSKTLSDALPDDVADITLSKHFPAPDYEALIGQGVDIKVLAAIKAMRDEIPAKPRVKHRLKRWGADVAQIRELSHNLLSGAIDIEKLMEKLQGSYALRKMSERIKLYAELGYPDFQAATGYRIDEGEWSLYKGVKYDPPMKAYAIMKDDRMLEGFPSREEALSFLKAKLAIEPTAKDRSVKLDVYQISATGEIVVGKKVASGKYIDLKGGFKTAREAHLYRVENEKALLVLLEKKKEIRPERRSVNDPRVGKDYRFGENVTPEKFAAEFGFRGVQFGNYVEQSRRYKDLNNAYDALLDLSRLIGVPSRAISLDGTLGLAFGARGKGGKDAPMAHYESDMTVINLTKKDGAGSLGHEWWHALDNNIGKRQKGRNYLTENPSIRKVATADNKLVDDDSIRPEVVQAFKEVMATIKASGLPKRSKDLDARKTKDYWSTDIEMSARAFEAYLIHKAAQAGESNDYLANIISEDAHKALDEMMKDWTGTGEPFPYPTREEMTTLAPAFDKLFATLKTRETDKGVEFYQSERGKINFKRDGTSVITLFRNRNLSTVLHESGHFYWNLLNDLAAMPNAPDQIKRDAAVMREWVGAKEGEKFTVDQEEQVARGFEAYLMEGKAPSIELRDSFRRFKAWLLRIYKSAVGLKVELTDEVRGVFDRMLATDEAIDRARRNPVFQPDPAIMEMLTQAEQDKYVKKASNALEEAREKLFKKALDQESRKQTRWWKDNWAEIEAQQASLLNQQNLYRAIFAVTKGTTPDGQQLEKRLKLDRKAVEALIGKEMAKQLPAGSLDRDGVNPSLVADLFNLGSANEMLFKMAEAEPYKKRLKDMTENVMRERFGDMLNDGTIEREALEALHSDLGAAQTEAEFHAVLDQNMKFADRPKRYRPKREVFESMAQGIIDRTQIRKIVPFRFYRAEVRAAKKAGEAIAVQDWKTAANAKKQQLLNHYLFKIAKDELNDIDKRIAKWSRLDKPDADLAKTLDMDYVYAARYVLQAYGIGKVSDFSQWQEQLQREDPGKLEELMGEIALHVASAQDYRDMDLYDFEGLAETVDFIMAKAKTSKTVTDGKNQMQLDDLIGILYKALDDEYGGRERVLTPAREGKPLADFVSDILEAGTQTNTVIEKLDGGVANGVLDRFIRQPIREGEALCALQEKAAGDKLLALLNKHYGKTKIGDYTITQENLISKSEAVYIRDISRSMTREEIISVALNWGNQDNRLKLRAGRPEFGGEIFGDAGIEAILKKMRKQDWEFVQDTWDLIDSYWPEIAALERRTKGAVPKKVEALPFTAVNEEGEVFELRGGYFPLKYDAELSIKVTEDTINEEFKLFALGRNAAAATRRGHTKERVEGVRRPVRLDGINVIREHLSGVIRDLTLREAIQNAHKILSHKDTRRAFEETAGPKMHRMFDIWLKDTAVGRVMGDRGLTSYAAGARHSTTVAAMGWKISTALVQITGLSQSVVELRPKWAFKGFMRMTQLGTESFDFVHEKSEFMKARGITFNRDVGDAMKRLERNGIVRDIQATFMIPMLKMQQVVDTVTWLGAYEKALADQRPGGDPVKYADLMVENAQGSGAFSAMAPVMRGTLGPNTRLNEWIKLYTVFMSYFNTKVNVAMRRANQTNFKDPADVATLGADYLMLFWFETVVGDFILGKMPDFEDDDEPWLSAAAYNFKAMMSTFMAGLPVLREAAAFMSGFGTTPPHVRGIEGTVDAGKNLVKVATAPFTDEDINWYKVARSMVDAGVYLSPVKYPAGQINVMIKALEQSSEGSEVSPADYLVAPPRK